MAIYFGSNKVNIKGGSVPTGIIPSGMMDISANGVYDITSYASASVNLEYYEVYKALAFRSGVNHNLSSFTDFISNLSYVKNNLFLNVDFSSGTYNFNSAVTIQENAFRSLNPFNGLVTDSYIYNFPLANYIGMSAFYFNGYITEISIPQCSLISDRAFYQCTNLRTISGPSCETIGESAFCYCSRLTEVNFSLCKTIKSSAFTSCRTLTTMYFPQCTSIGGWAFNSCSSLISANLPSCTYIDNGAFYYCISLTTVNASNCSYIGSSAFRACYSLNSVIFSSCSYIGSFAFTNCRSLSVISFPNCSYIGSYAFQSCYNLLSLYLMGSSIPSLVGISVFDSTPISNYTTSTGGVYGSIYVPSSLYTAYTTATNWNTYASRFVSV